MCIYIYKYVSSCMYMYRMIYSCNGFQLETWHPNFGFDVLLVWLLLHAKGKNLLPLNRRNAATWHRWKLLNLNYIGVCSMFFDYFKGWDL